MTGFEQQFRDRSVLVTGHTGFTGGWLTLWLDAIGARVHGLALPPPTAPSLFEIADVASSCRHTVADIRDAAAVARCVQAASPEIVLHLAAQPLVSRSYEDPVESFAVNTLGTAHVLEAARNTASVKAFVCITTDKVYEDKGWAWGYRETDALGGKDAYSASKAAAELVTAAYRSTLAPRANKMLIAVARGGNIIGGGDWADNRIVPDFMRAITSGAPLVLRHPEAVRPWQHVLALVHGYLALGAHLLAGDANHARSYNFGPRDDEIRSVRDLVEGLSARWRRPDIRYGEATFLETQLLRVDSSLSRGALGWRPPIGFSDTLDLTVGWYRALSEKPARMRDVTRAQIDAYRTKIAGTAEGAAPRTGS